MVSFAHSPDWEKAAREWAFAAGFAQAGICCGFAEDNPLQIRCKMIEQRRRSGRGNLGFLRAYRSHAQPPGEISLLVFCRCSKPPQPRVAAAGQLSASTCSIVSPPGTIKIGMRRRAAA